VKSALDEEASEAALQGEGSSVQHVFPHALQQLVQMFFKKQLRTGNRLEIVTSPLSPGAHGDRTHRAGLEGAVDFGEVKAQVTMYQAAGAG
jgi:hypothetical protein